ncbi:MAG: hypothetical protein KKH92_07870 [Firmicutes bacterium]|nr:hypothetical protein [Bacillota bacterium]
MKDFGIVFYSFLYVMELIVFVINGFTSEYRELGPVIFVIGFIIFWIIGFIEQFSNKGFQVFMKEPLSFLSLDIKNKFSTAGKTYIYMTSAIFIGVVVFGFFLPMYYGGGPDIVEGVYVVTSHGRIARESITKFEYDILVYFETQMFVSISLLLFSGIVIYLKDDVKNKKPLQSFGTF